MRLLICTQAMDSEDPALGFFHHWVLEFAKHAEGIEVLCLREGKHDLPAHVHVHSLGKERGVSRLTYLIRFYFFSLRYLFRYDSVFVHMNPEYAILGWPLWKLAGKKRVLWYAHKSTPIRLRLGSRLVHTICTASPESFRLKRSHLVVTGHGIDVSLFSIPRLPAPDFLRLCVLGRISRSKGIHVILEALTDLPKNGVPYQLMIVGAPMTRDDERYQKELQQYIEAYNLRSVTCMGAQPTTAIPLLLSRFDILVHPSTTGSLDKVILEAMAAECVVISSNDAARPILAKIHPDCVVAEPRAELFVRALKNIYSLGKDGRHSLGEKGRAIVAAEHALPNLIDQLVGILKNQ
jgi:glycosyltransferase involved in cell wall biosynthesis